MATTNSRTKRGQFAPGHSGNPSGRPAGSRNARTVFLHSLLDGDAEAIIAALVTAAKKGKPAALRLATERLIPARAARDRSAEMQLPRCSTAADVAEACAEVLDRAAAGEITLEAATAFLKLLELQRRTIETADLEQRLQELADAGSEEAGNELDRLARRRRGTREDED